MRVHDRVWRWVVALVMLLGGAAWAGEPTAQPMLRLETGMHTAVIRRIATDAHGRWAVTASDDKTARIWSVATGQLEGVLRVPQDTGDEGKLYAVAMSPDGAQVAVAGRSADNEIYLFDRATQRLQGRISGLPNVVLHMAYSSDGRWLAAGLGGQNGVRVFEPNSGKQVGSDNQYGGNSYSVEFSPKDSPGGLRLLSTSYDSQIRLYDVADTGQLTLHKSNQPSGGKRPLSARLSPDGKRIAVGFYDTRSVQVLDAQTLGLQATLDTSGGTAGDFSAVAWSADSRVLAAAGRAADAERRVPIRRWSAGKWSNLGDVPVSGSSVMDLVTMPKAKGGGWLFASGDPTWGVLDSKSKLLQRQDGTLAGLFGLRDQLLLSTDGQQVRFAYLYGGKAPARFDLSSRSLAGGEAGAGIQLNAARLEAPALVVKDWKDTFTPSLNAQPIKLRQDEIAHSLAIAPDGEHFALGAEWSLRYFDRTGKERWQQPVPGIVWALNISQDGRWVVAGYADGTIRWHRSDNGREVLAFFPHADRKRWVLWTPEGFYDASPDAEDLIGYHLNRGKDQEGEFVGARQLREAFYQPNLISQRLGPDGDAVMQAAVAKLGDVRERLRARTTPEITLESPATATTDGSYSPVIKIVNVGEGKARLVMRLDGKEIDPRWNGPALSTNQRIPLPPLPRLTPGVRKVSIELVDGRGIASRAVEATITVRRTAATTAPTLHVLAIGISKYLDGALNQGVVFAANDAQAVASALERGGKGLFGQVNTTVLTDKNATRAGILKAGTALGATEPEDTVVLYLAGHGFSEDSEYHFVPQDVRFSNRDRLREGSITASDLRDLLKGITAQKVLVLMDTCSSGGFASTKGRTLGDKGALDRLQRLTGRATLAATADEQMALEGEGDARGRHGVFTFALLRGLEGAADHNRNGEITLGELGLYIDDQVPKITERRWGVQQIPLNSIDGSLGLLLARPVR